MRLTLAEDTQLADAYARRFDLSGAALEPPAVPVPRGHRFVDRRADLELAEKTQARKRQDGTSYAAAMHAVLAEEPALRSRYEDFTSRHTALDELAYRAETIRAAATPREHMTPAKAAALALSEDPVLKDAVYCYFEPA
jgi:hypothetical protein